MGKKLIIISIVLMSVATVLVLMNKLSAPPESYINNNAAEIVEIIPEKDQEKSLQEVAATNILKEINDKSDKIKSISCDHIIVRLWYQGIWYNGLNLKLKGNLYYEKPKNFHMTVHSLVGKEFVMGSNNEEFWFWSKRLHPSSLYHAKHEDINKTRLKSAFNPLMVMDSLGINPLYYGVGVAVKEEGSKIFLVQKRVNSIGQPIGYITVVDKDEKRLIGHMVTDDDGVMIASSEILEYKDGLPYKILYRWEEEDQVMLIELPNAKTNQKLSADLWKRPDIKPQINMGETKVDFKWNLEKEDELLQRSGD